MLRNDKLFITLIISLVCSALFTLGFINIAYCIDEYNNINTFVGTFSSPYNETQFRIETSVEAFSCLSSDDSFYGDSGYTLADSNFYESFYVKDERESDWFARFQERESTSRTFHFHGISYTYYYVINNSYYGSYANDLRCSSGNGATVDFTSIDLTDGLSGSDYIYLVWKGIIKDDNFKFPEGYYIPDNVIVESASDTLSSQYSSDKWINVDVAIPNTTHASYLNIKSVDVTYSNILAYLDFGVPTDNIFKSRTTDFDCTFSLMDAYDEHSFELNYQKYDKYIIDLDEYIWGDLYPPLIEYSENEDNFGYWNIRWSQMPYKSNDINIAYREYKERKINLDDYTFPNLPTSTSIKYGFTLSDANLSKESDVFYLTVYFDVNGKLMNVEYSGGVQPNGDIVKPQSYDNNENYNNLISKNDSEQGNQTSEDLTEDAEEEDKQLTYDTDDWQSYNINSDGFKGTVTSFMNSINLILPFMQQCLFFIPAWVFGIMSVGISAIIIMRVLGR